MVFISPTCLVVGSMVFGRPQLVLIGMSFDAQGGPVDQFISG